MALLGSPLLLQTQGRFAFLLSVVHICFPTPLRAASDTIITFDSHIVPAAIPKDGLPGRDYPLLSVVPDTGFSCTDQQAAGYYADTAAEAACQVFHVCQPDGRQNSFLCPNGTVFSQQYFVCDWWYNVDCGASEKFRQTIIDLGASEADHAAAASQTGSTDPASSDGRIVTKSVHLPVPPTLPHSHKQTHHHTFTSHTAAPVRPTPPLPRNTGTHQATQQPHLQAALNLNHQSNIHVLLHQPATLPSQQLETPSRTQSVHSSQLVTSILNHESTSDSVPQSSVTDNYYSNHQTFSQHSDIQSHKSTYQTFSLSNVTQSHNPTLSPTQLPSKQHPTFPTLFRENVTTLPPLQTRSSSRDKPSSQQSSLRLTPAISHIVSHENIVLNNAESLTAKKNTFPSQVGEQENSLTSSQFKKDHDFKDSLEDRNSLTGLLVPYDNEESVEYDEIYSASLFPPTIPQVADVYESAKGNVLIEIVRETGAAPSFPSIPLSTHDSLFTKGSLVHAPKPQHTQAKQKYNEPIISNRIPRTQNFFMAHEFSPSDLSSSTVISSSQDRSLQPPHQLFSGHSTLLARRTSLPHQRSATKDSTLPQPFTAANDSMFPHHVWRPSHGPFPLSLVTSPAPDTTSNFPISSPQAGSIASATSGAFKAHPSSPQPFKVIHETFPSSQSSVETHSSFFAKHYDTLEPLELPSRDHKPPGRDNDARGPRLLSPAVHKSPAERHVTQKPFSMISIIHKSSAEHLNTPEPSSSPTTVHQALSGHDGTPETHLLPSTPHKSPVSYHVTPEPFLLPSNVHKSPAEHRGTQESFPFFFKAHKSSAGHLGNSELLSLSSGTHTSSEKSSRPHPKSRQSFLVIHETSPLGQGAPLPPHHVLLRENDSPVQSLPLDWSSPVQELLEVPTRSISDTHDSFSVIQESSLRVDDTVSPSLPRLAHPVPATTIVTTQIKAPRQFSS